MPGLDATRLRALADELEREEAEARREAEDAETRTAREQAEARVAELEQKIAALEQKLADGPGTPPPPATTGTEEEEQEEEGEEEPKPKMRKGRKRGQVYQNGPGEPGYVWQGEDEPDLVPVEETAA